MRADPKSAKKTDSLIVFFALLRLMCVKASSKMLVKLTPVIDLCCYFDRVKMKQQPSLTLSNLSNLI